MRRSLLLACALAGSLAITLPGRAAPAVPPLTPAPSGQCGLGTQENVRVPVGDGSVSVYVRLFKPTNCQNPQTPKPPVILEMTPYSGIAALAPQPDTTLVRRGYVYALADVPGTGQSGGCWDYGGAREQEAAYDLVEWLGTRSWSLGPVGMIGGSYDGTTAIMAAITHPPHLRTIVPEVAIGDWYGYAYHDGVRYSVMDPAQRQGLVIDEQGLDTPVSFDALYGAIPPQRDTDTGFQDRLVQRLCPEADKAIHTMKGYSPQPDKDAFWAERDYTARASTLRDVTVLVQGGWRDYNVKHSESSRFFAAIPVDDPQTGAVEGVPYKMLVMGQGAHGIADPDFGFTTLERAWFDRWLLGYPSNVEFQPSVMTKANDGVIRAEESWPAPGTAAVSLFPSGNGVLASAPVDAATMSYADTGTETENGALSGTAPGSLLFASAALQADLRIEGVARLELDVATSATETHFTPVLFDLGPPVTQDPSICTFPTASNACTITRGFLNARYRNGLALGEDLTPFAPYHATVRFIDNDWVVKAGHRIGLAVMSSNAWWAVPDAVRALNQVLLGSGTALVLPVVGGSAALAAAGL